MAAAAATGLVRRPALAKSVQGSGKRVLQIFLHGGVSQLETWDPKPGTATGGPFRAIPTSVPGLHISELLPHTALQMHRLGLIRSMTNASDDHGRGQREIFSGRNQPAALDVPDLGAVVAKTCMPDDFPLPGHILIRGSGGGPGNASYLGPRYAGVIMEDAKPPAFTDRPEGLSPEADRRRSGLRSRFNDRFATRRRTADTECGDNAEDTPRDAGFARAVGAKHDTDADADHGEIPDEWKEEAEGVRTGSQPHQGDGADGHEQCASGERADGEFFHRGRRAQGR
jgi:hypothetical protein